MPGVPSGGRCDACRKQKKKCVFSEPPCTRCIRLKISCVGTQRRFKILTPVIAGRNVTSTKSSACPQATFIDQEHKIFRNLGSENLSLAQVLIHHLNIVDMRYNISSYGMFLNDVPSRIGTNEALDAAVLAFTSILSNLHLPAHPYAALRHLGQAIQSLRRCISDPKVARNTNTLCAVWLIWACEGLLTSHEDWSTGHGIGGMYLLNGMDLDHCNDAFDLGVVRSICAPVIIEALFNHKINLDPCMTNLVARLEPTALINEALVVAAEDDVTGTQFTVDSISMRNMLRLSKFLRNPSTFLNEAEILYRLLRAESRRIDRWLARPEFASGGLTPQDISSPSAIQVLVNRCQAGKSGLLCMALILNKVLQGIDSQNETLKLDEHEFSVKMLNLAESNRALRPLGMRYGVLLLMVARACSDDIVVCSKAENLMAEQFPTEALSKWINGTHWLRSAIQEVGWEGGYRCSIGRDSG